MAQINELDAVAREEAGTPEPAPAPSPVQAATPRPEPVQSPPPLVPSEPTAPVEMVAGPPRLPTVEELDAIEPQSADSGLTELDAAIAQEQAKEHPLEALDLGRFQEMLEHEGWTIPGLANADAAELTPYPGVGKVTAENIIKKAQGHQGG